MPLHVFFPCFGTKTVPFLERESCIRHGVMLVYTSSVRQAKSINPDYLSQIESKICLLCTCISHFKKDLDFFCQQTKISCSNFPKMAESSFPKHITVFSITIWLSDNSLPRKRFVLVNSKKETSPF